MANNFGDDPVHKEPDPNYKVPEYPKSEREQETERLMAAHEAAATPEEKASTQKTMLKHVEGDNFFSTTEGVKIILLNAPPRSGKDLAAEMAMNYLGKRGQQYRFAAPLKHTIHAMFGYNGVPEEYFTDTKDTPDPERFAAFDPPTWRQAYIWMSENVVKPMFGHDHWARIAVTSVSRMKKPVIVISDCGFVEEAQVLVQAFGKENVALVHIARDGCEFKTGPIKDSRNYITSVDCVKFDIDNNGTVEALYDRMVQILDEFAPDAK